MTHSAFLEQFLAKLQTPRVSLSHPEIQHELVGELTSVSDLALANSRGPRVDCIRSLLLLQAGGFERSHSIVQAMSGSDPAYIHGMIHRVEGDFWNAKYWFRRSKKHPAFLDTPIDPFRITDLVEQAKGKPPSPTTIQDLKTEFGKLLDFLLGASASG
ncbi:MAG: hypothetical protein JOZ21_06395 [Verrucomicrobia bacterium]|nr:hypothetical protein [Verrucomicrobiota bacterium]